MSDTSPYTITVEDAGPARKRVSVTIASATVDTQLQQQLAAVSASVQLPGFRKGKVPRAVVEKRFGQAIGDETRNEIVKEALQEAITEHELDLLNTPEPSDESMPVVEQGKDFSFSVEMDIVPAFELPDFGSIELRKPQLEVTDDLINEEIERQCMRNGKGETLQDGFKPGDRMLGHASVLPKGEDEPVFVSENILVVLPEAGERGQVLGLHSRENDLIVNPAKGKKLTNVRSSGTDDAIRLTPPRVMSLEDALEFIADDELVECTPTSIRIRKRILDHNGRKRAAKG